MKSRSVLDLLEEEHHCPYCSARLTLCHAPPIHVGDGLGWGSEYLFVCLNDECKLFVNGWKNIENNYGHVGSYRHMKLPDSNESYSMMVAGKEAFTGSVVDPEQIKRVNVRYQKEREATAALATCVADKNPEPVLYLLLDDHVSLAVKQRAAELLPALNDLACIEPLRNHTFRDPHLEQTVNMAIASIMAANYVKECPYCAELVKVRANLCKHCGKELA
ncbi:MAG: zinc ribbon domain-containing protein [Desulfobulbaceae bacterium]